MNISKVKALLVAVRLSSISKAAKELNYTQSGLTQMIQSLENEIGMPLIERSPYGIKFNKNGEKLLPYFNDLCLSSDKLENAIKNISKDENEVINIGAYSSIAMHWLPSILEQFKNEYPDIRVQFSCSSVKSLYEGVENNLFDFAFVSKNNKFKVKFLSLKEDRFYAILPPSYSSKYERQFDVKNFEGENFLMPSIGFEIDIMACLNKSKVKLNYQSPNVDDPTIISMVEHGLGVSMLTELVLKNRKDNILALPIFPDANRHIGIITRQNKILTPAMKRLVEISKKTVESI